MADWPDPRTSTTAFGGPATDVRASYDAGLRAHMLAVYNYMASGVLLTGIIAMLFAPYAPAYLYNPATGGMNGLGFIVALAPLGFIIALNIGFNRMQTSTMKALFWAFAAVMGLSMSTIFLQYTGESIAQTFFATAAAYLGLSLFGYTTKKDLSAIGTFLIMGVFGLIIMMALNIFIFHSAGMDLAICAVGVLIFAGLTAYHTQKVKSIYAQVAGTEFAGKAVVMSALTLYLDFINMFLFLLRFMGNSRN